MCVLGDSDHDNGGALMISNFPTFTCTDNDIAGHNDAPADDGGVEILRSYGKKCIFNV